MIDFCAIDFETATHERNSACEMGISVVENGEIVKNQTWLIKPPSFPYFHPRNIDVHGITPEDVQDAPTFEEIWHGAENMMYGSLLIADNASFDAPLMRWYLEYYGIFNTMIN